MANKRKPDRRIRRTRRQLFRALHDLIKEIPYDEISVSKIVNEADISRATFYLHYKDKHDLLIASLESLLAEVSETLQNSPSPDLQSLALQIFQHVQDHHELYQAIYQADTASFVMLNGWVDIIESSLQLSLTAPEEEIEMIAHQVAGGLYAIVLWWLKHDMSYSPLDMAHKFSDFTMPHTKPPTN